MNRRELLKGLVKHGSSHNCRAVWWNIHFSRLWVSFILQWQSLTFGVRYDHLRSHEGIPTPENTSIHLDLFFLQIVFKYFHSPWPDRDCRLKLRWERSIGIPNG